MFLFVSAPLLRAKPPRAPWPQPPPQDSSTTAPARAAAPAVPRTKILAGTWRLNLDESDDPAKKMQQSRGSNSGQGAGRRGGGGMGGGWPGGGMGGRGGMGGSRGGQGGGESDSDREKMHVFVEPARELNISQKDPEIDLADDANRKLALYTDGRKLEKSKDQNHQELPAKWESYRLVAEGKDPRGNKYERSYEVLDGNQQLRETLYLKVSRNQTEITVRYVYDLVAPASSQPPATH